MEPVTIGRATRIYALCEWPSQEPRYVGKTVQLIHHRRAAHFSDARRGSQKPLHRWIRKRHANGKLVAVKLLEVVEHGGDWQAAERTWIARFREGGRLLNLTDGGEGLPGHKFSDDHRAKIAASRRTGAYFNCETCDAQFWRRRRDIALGHNRFCSRGCYAKSLEGVSRPFPANATQRGIEAAAAARRARTHCKRHHPLSGDNLFITASGARGCKECRKIHKLTYRSKANG